MKTEGELKLETKFKIKYDDDAMFELDEIYLYIRDELKEEKIAEKTVKKIREKIRVLNNFPFAYKLITKSKSFEYRKFIIKNYIVIYKINLKEKEINILHIYNQKQKIINKKYIVKFRNNKNVVLN